MTESWVTESQRLMQSWTEAQARLWGDWADMAAKLGTLSAPAAGNQFEQWQSMGRRVVDAWPWDTDGVSRQVVERMFAGEEAFLQVVTQTLEYASGRRAEDRGGRRVGRAPAALSRLAEERRRSKGR